MFIGILSISSCMKNEIFFFTEIIFLTPSGWKRILTKKTRKNGKNADYVRSMIIMTAMRSST